MDIFQQLTRDEGTKRDKDGYHIAYKCSGGFWTIGKGHNLDANPIPGITKDSRLTDAQADAILRDDVAKVEQQLQRNLPWVTRLDDARKGVLINMAFNLGIGGLLTFKNTLARVAEGDYTAAARGMLASKWATQVGARATRLAKQMETGARQ